jgi:hypothetical protein
MNTLIINFAVTVVGISCIKMVYWFYCTQPPVQWVPGLSRG